jgi:hypothetical protein
LKCISYTTGWAVNTIIGVISWKTSELFFRFETPGRKYFEIDSKIKDNEENKNYSDTLI